MILFLLLTNPGAAVSGSIFHYYLCGVEPSTNNNNGVVVCLDALSLLAWSRQLDQSVDPYYNLLFLFLVPGAVVPD